MKKYSHWQIAYRRNKEDKFKLIDNPPYGWAADPFLVQYKEKTLLFAEIFLYESERNGVIGYCEVQEDGIGEWKIAMDKRWHLSYPNVFVDDGELYMCPESYQREEVALYRLIELPDKWERVEVLLDNIKVVDTTFFECDGQSYMFTFVPTFRNAGGRLQLYKKVESKWTHLLDITEDKSLARPGGKMIESNGKLYRVAQDSSKAYGTGLVFLEIESIEPEYREREVKRLYPRDIKIESERFFEGLHTYNELNGIEVIDLKYNTFSFKELMAQRRVRKVFTNKY